jgi:hypothetical protein
LDDAVEDDWQGIWQRGSRHTDAAAIAGALRDAGYKIFPNEPPIDLDLADGARRSRRTRW